MKSDEESSFTEDERNAKGCVEENADASATNNGSQTIRCYQSSFKRVYNLNKLRDISISSWNLPPFDFEYPPQQPLASIFLNQKECPTVNTEIQKFKEIITDVATDLEDEQYIPRTQPLEKMAYAIQLCRTMSQSGLKQAIGRIMDKTIKSNKLLVTERKLYRDVLVMCGTGPAIWIIKEWIEQYKVTGEEAANIIVSIPAHLRDPRPQVVQLLYNLTQAEAVTKDRQLSITANLALSNFIRIACINKRARETHFPRTVLSPACTQEHIEPYLKWFSSQLYTEPSLRRVFTLALGNTGSHDSLEMLKYVAMNPKYSAYLRATAVVAMKYQAFLYPEDTSKVLFSLFRDYTQPIPVRLSAVSMLFFSKPHYDIWQSIALSTWYEPSTSLAAFVRSSLVTFSEFKDPAYQSESKNARRVVLYSKPISTNLTVSDNLLRSIIFKELEEIWTYQRIITQEIDARSFYFRFTKRISELTRLPFDGEIWLSNKDEFLNTIKNWFYPQGIKSELRPPIENLERTTSRVRQILNIHHRDMPDMEGDVHVSFDKLSERLFDFDKKSLKEWLNGLEKSKGQIQFHYQNSDSRELEFCAVTEMGFPLCFKHYEPWFFRLTANFKSSQLPPAFESSFNYMFEEHRIGKLSFYTPWDRQVYSVQSHVHTFAQIPEIHLKAQLITEPQRLKFEVQTKVPQGGHTLLHHSRQIFTSHRNVGDITPRAKSRTWKPIHFKPSSQVSKSFKLGRHFEAHYNYSTELAYPSPFDCGYNSGSLYGFWMMLSSLNPSSIDIKILNVPNMQFDIGIGCAKAENGEASIAYDADISRSETKSMSAREADLLGQIEIGTNISRKTRTIPSGSVRPTVTEKPTVPHTTVPPTQSPVLSPAKELLSNIISQTARDVVEEVMHRVKGNQNTEKAGQLVSEVFDASSINFTQPQDYPTLFLRKSLNGISNGESKIIYMNITLSRPHKSEKHEDKYTALFAYAKSDNRTQQNLEIFIREETEPKEWEIGWTSTFQSPKVSPLNLKDLNQTSLEAVLVSNLEYRLQDKYYSTILQVNMDRSEKRTEVLNKRLIQQQCSDLITPECRNLAYEAMFSDTYNVTVVYNNEEQYLAPWIEKSLDLTSFYLLPYGSKTQWKNNSRSGIYNVMNVAFNVAEDLHSFNIHADTNSKNMVFQNIPVEPELIKMLLYNPHHKFSILFTPPTVCGISLGRVYTFDEVDYDYNMTPKWHVLTKDATGKTRFMSLAKAAEDATMALEVNIDNHVMASINSSGVIVQQGKETIENNTNMEYGVVVQQGKETIEDNTTMEYRDRNGTLLLQLNYISEPEFIVTLQCPEHGMDIIYKKNAILIQAHEMTRGRVVGLCGDNNGEKIAEFQTPTGTIVESAQEFASSYVLPDDLTTDHEQPSSSNV